MQLKEMFFLKKRGRKKGEGWGEKEIRAKEAHGNEEGNATRGDGEKGKERKKRSRVISYLPGRRRRCCQRSARPPLSSMDPRDEKGRRIWDSRIFMRRCFKHRPPSLRLPLSLPF